MKLIISISFLCLGFVCAKAQETKPVEPSKGTTFEKLLKVEPKKNGETADLNSQFTLGDDCGDTAYESQRYDQRKGKIIKIPGANKVLFNQTSVDGNKEKNEFTIELVGIDAEQNNAAVEKALQDILLKQTVEITGNLRNDSDKTFGGVVRLIDSKENIDEVNIYLLESGIAKYKPFESANLVSMVMPCRLQKAEERAKTAKVGIWAK
jgi:endonuclease YncB( thermonuclease family)